MKIKSSRSAYITAIAAALLLALSVVLPSCAKAGAPDTASTSGADEADGDTAVTAEYVSISQEEAKRLIDEGGDLVILDVRTQSEFDSGHIPGAVLIPYDEIVTRAEAELPDKEQLILVYCRSGNRSKTASQSLAGLGYTNIKEFGGINTWAYDTVVPDAE